MAKFDRINKEWIIEQFTNAEKGMEYGINNKGKLCFNTTVLAAALSFSDLGGILNHDEFPVFNRLIQTATERLNAKYEIPEFGKTLFNVAANGV